MDDPHNGLREQVRQLSIEVQSLRDTRHEHASVLAGLTIIVEDLQKTAEELSIGMEQAKLDDRELKTNWRLTATMGAAGVTLLIGLMLFIATHGTT